MVKERPLEFGSEEANGKVPGAGRGIGKAWVYSQEGEHTGSSL